MQQNKFKSVFSLIVLSFFCGWANAKTQCVEIHLVQVVAQKTADDSGDRLYFDITDYPTEGEAKLSRMPMFPLHWLTKEAPSIKNVLLWKGTITDDNSTIIVLSLMDQALPLLATDKLIGSVRVEIINKNNRLKTSWGQPNYVDQPRVEQIDAEPRYVMFGDNSQYAVDFKIVVIK